MRPPFHPEPPFDTVRALRWTDEGLAVLDQRLLPETLDYQLCRSASEVALAIASMRVRGAPAIGIAAAYGVALAAKQRFTENPEAWKSLIEQDLLTLAGARPTAVNLFWAIDRMRTEIGRVCGDPALRLHALAESIHAEDIAANRIMGELGAHLIGDARGILTHCNTGSLATGGYGTALGVVRSACARGSRQIFATETRPWLQGARLTLWELLQDRIPATLIADSAAALLMRQGRVDWIIVGADRVAANGDTANKIGTYSLAGLARRHGVRTMVVAPTSTIDCNAEGGENIVIEQRPASELLPPFYAAHDALIGAWNPVFDITPADLIDALVTERGVVERPTAATLTALLDQTS